MQPKRHLVMHNSRAYVQSRSSKSASPQVFRVDRGCLRGCRFLLHDRDTKFMLSEISRFSGGTIKALAAETHRSAPRHYLCHAHAIRDQQPRNPHSKSLARCRAERPEETRVFACEPCAAEIWRFRQSTQGFWRSRYARTRAHRGG